MARRKYDRVRVREDIVRLLSNAEMQVDDIASSVGVGRTTAHEEVVKLVSAGKLCKKSKKGNLGRPSVFYAACSSE